MLDAGSSYPSRRRSLRRAALLPALALLLVLAGAVAAQAGQPRRGGDYEGGIVLHPSTGTTTVPFEFGVSRDGTRVGPFTIPNGAPGAPGCELGPIGFPVKELAPIDDGGRFSARLRLISPGEPNPGENLGQVVIVGKFLSGGKAAGTIETRGGPKGCDGTFRWHAAAR